MGMILVSPQVGHGIFPSSSSRIAGDGGMTAGEEQVVEGHKVPFTICEPHRGQETTVLPVIVSMTVEEDRDGLRQDDAPAVLLKTGDIFDRYSCERRTHEVSRRVPGLFRVPTELWRVDAIEPERDPVLPRAESEVDVDVHGVAIVDLSDESVVSVSEVARIMGHLNGEVQYRHNTCGGETC